MNRFSQEAQEFRFFLCIDLHNELRIFLVLKIFKNVFYLNYFSKFGSLRVLHLHRELRIRVGLAEIEFDGKWTIQDQTQLCFKTLEKFLAALWHRNIFISLFWPFG